METEYESCIACKENLAYEDREGVSGFPISLGYCPNSECTRYLLFTTEAPGASGGSQGERDV